MHHGGGPLTCPQTSITHVRLEGSHHMSPKKSYVFFISSGMTDASLRPSYISDHMMHHGDQDGHLNQRSCTS
jgi:hypothetical protein